MDRGTMYWYEMDTLETISSVIGCRLLESLPSLSHTPCHQGALPDGAKNLQLNFVS
jgi:hypothetical protein